MEEKFREIFEKSPIGILFYDKEGKLIDVNQSAMQIAGIPSIEVNKKVNLFSDPNISSRQEDLLSKGYIKFQAPINFDKIRKLGFYNPTRTGTVFIDYIISVTDSGFLVQIQDITKQKEAEELLKENEEKFSKVFYANPGAIAILKLEGPILEVNDEFINLTGYSRDEIIGHSSVDLNLVSPEFREKLYKKMQEKGSYHNLEIEIQTKSGEKRVVLNTIENIEIRGQKRILSIFYDITDLKKAEEIEERLKVLMDNNPSLVFMKDEDGRYVYLNKSYEDQFIHSKDWYGKTDFDFWPKESAEIFRANDAEVLESGKIHQFLEDSIGPDGTRYVWLNYKFPFTDSENKRYVGGVGIDATSQICAEEALRESEERYSELFNSMSEMFQVLELVYDDNGRAVDFYYQDVNPATEKLLNMSRDQIVGKRAKELFGTVEDYWIQALSQVNETKEPMHINNYSAELDKYYDVNAFKVEGQNKVAIVFTDITERKKSEYKLKESEERFRVLNETAPVGVAVSSDGVFLYTNPAYERMLGYGPGELIGRKASDFYFDPNDRDKWCSVMKEEGVAHDFETKWKKKDGILLWVSINVSPITYGNKEGVIGIAQDITERKNVEEALKESEEKYRHIVEFAPTGIYEIDYSSPKFKTVNDAMIQILGYSREELLNMTPFDILSDESKEIFQDRIQKVLSGEKVDKSVDFEIKTKNGHELWTNLNIKLTYENGKPKGALVVAHDITERKKAEEKTKSILENIQEYYMEVDNEWRILDANSKYEELFRLKKNDMVGKIIWELFPQTVGSKLYNQLHKSKNKNIHLHFEYKSILGGEKWFEAYAYPSKTGLISYGHDITERKKAEEALKQAHDMLEETVEERTAELEEAYQYLKENETKLKDTISALEQSNKELRSFAYITSHDLQEPLRTVASFTQLLQRRYEGKFDSDADEFMNYTVEASKRMKDMIQGLLEYSRIDREIEFVETDMDVKVEKAVSNLHTAIEESNAEITYDNLPTVYADPDQMVRVFQNFIGNAIKFKKPQLPPRIHISSKLDEKNKEYIFSVEDNGIGMEPEYTNKIFEVFKRLHTIDEYEGTGIGLSIVKRIIERHGGRIWVESSFGVGSTFYFTIPIKGDKLNG